MKKIITTIALIVAVTTLSYGQKFGYIDSQKVLDKMPAYEAAQKEVEQVSEQWQEELEDMYKEIEKKYNYYQAEEVLLPDDVKKQRQEEIFELERQAKEYKKSKFGYDGELYVLQDEKIKPVQDLVFEAVELLAKEKKLNFIIDISGNTGIIYADPLYNRTKDVMTRLGIK